MPRQIPVSGLMVGMTVLDEHLKPDVTLAEKFNDGSRFTRYAFVTTHRKIVMWHNCGHVWIK